MTDDQAIHYEYRIPTITTPVPTSLPDISIQKNVNLIKITQFP